MYRKEIYLLSFETLLATSEKHIKKQAIREQSSQRIRKAYIGYTQSLPNYILTIIALLDWQFTHKVFILCDVFL